MTESLFSHKRFFKNSRAATKQTELIHISQEEISSRISEVIDSSLIKRQSLCLLKNNIRIVIYNDGYTIQAFHGGKNVAEFSYKTNEGVKSAIGVFLFSLLSL